MLFGGPHHHLSSRHPPEQPCYADIVSNLAPRPSKWLRRTGPGARHVRDGSPSHTCTSPEEQRVRSEGACNVRRIRGVRRAVYRVRKEEPCGRFRLQQA